GRQLVRDERQLLGYRLFAARRHPRSPGLDQQLHVLSRTTVGRPPPSRSESGRNGPASVGGGGCILRAPVRPVDLERHAPGEGSRVDQVERYVRAGLGEEPLALSDDYGDREEVHL